MALTQAEANNLASASYDVLKLYNFDVGAEAVAWGNLIIAIGTAYVPRAVAYGNRKKMERARNVTPQGFQAPAAVVTQPGISPAETTAGPSQYRDRQGPVDAATEAGIKIGPDFFN